MSSWRPNAIASVRFISTGMTADWCRHFNDIFSGWGIWPFLFVESSAQVMELQLCCSSTHINNVTFGWHEQFGLVNRYQQLKCTIESWLVDDCQRKGWQDVACHLLSLILFLVVSMATTYEMINFIVRNGQGIVTVEVAYTHVDPPSRCWHDGE